MNCEANVQIDEPFVDAVNQHAIAKLVGQTLTAVVPDRAAALTIVITDDTTIRTLNRDYLGIDEPTDVMAFSQAEGTALPEPVAGLPYLGDVIVSYQQAETQARQYGQSVERELSRLVVHGTLHLLGFDDQRAADRTRMWEIQENILSAADLEGEASNELRPDTRTGNGEKNGAGVRR